ncbi:MAG: 5-(carboxyamino)imidazole ribonucleotide mutase [Firmicutes bacterium]|nr:5-(carboxyamino)imidazole ribonucleotide mutase [Bacillota bacterium]
MSKPKAALLMGSKSDFEVAKAATDILNKLGVETETHVMSAHRTPEIVAEFVKNAPNAGIEVIIAAAGKAAHLAGVVAAFTLLPVIGIPMKTSDLGGLDSLLSMVQMPSGIPVATVAVGGAENAGILAAQILALKYPAVAAALKAHRKAMEESVVEADKSLPR